MSKHRVHREDLISITASPSIYKQWTFGSYLCWKNNCTCEGCSEKRICDSVKPMAHIPYKMKPMKYAVMNLVKNVGTEGLDERYKDYNFDLRVEQCD